MKKGLLKLEDVKINGKLFKEAIIEIEIEKDNMPINVYPEDMSRDIIEFGKCKFIPSKDYNPFIQI